MRTNTEKYIIRKFDNETLLLDVESGTSHILDDVATLMFDYFEKYEKKEVVLEHLFDYFSNESNATIEQDYNNFLHELIEKGIVICD